MIYKKITVEVYMAPVWVVVDPQSADFVAARHLRMSLDETAFQRAHGFCAYSERGDMIWLPEGASHGTIAHECTHAALNIFHRRQIEVDTSNQEPLTYLIGFLVNRVTDAAFKMWGRQ